MSAAEQHWTQDDELIERFVLHKLNPEERNELEDHLRICEVCKRAVRAEQQLIAGLRRAGREQFKSSLRTKLTSLPVQEKNIPWMQVLRAAAVIAIVLSVGIFNRWFETEKQETSLSQVQGDDQSKQRDKAEQLESAKKDDTRGTDKLESPPPTSQPAQFAEKSASQEELRRIAASPRGQVSPPEMADGETESATEAGTRAKPITLVGKEAARAGEEHETYWLEGTIISSGDELRDNVSLQGRAATDGGYRSKKYSTKKETDDAARVESKQQIPNTALALSQQNSLSLPSAQLQQQAAPTKVMTRFRRVDNRIEVTLFLDSLLDADELSHATLETPRSDSLVVNLRNQRIGYQLPHNLDARQLRIAK